MNPVRKTKNQIGKVPGRKLGPNALSTYSEQGLLSRALEDRWKIPEKAKAAALSQTAAIVENLELPIATRQKAISNMLKMEAINLKQMQILMPKTHVHITPSELSDEELEAAILEEAQNIQEKRGLFVEASDRGSDSRGADTGDRKPHA